MLGLTRGFMYAGVPRVVVSLWSVSDRGTSELMQRFYWALSEGGASPPTALRAAQISMLGEEKWHDPYYWAPFVLQGEWLSPREAAGGIEEDAIGGGSQIGDDPDFPIPFCRDYTEPWKTRICETLFRLRHPPHDSAEDTTRGAQPPPSPSQSSHLLFLSGIDAVTGEPAHPPVDEMALARQILERRRDWSEERELRWSHEQFKDRGVDRRPMPDVDPRNLASSGWAVVFAKDTPGDVRDALSRLLRHRKKQATSKEEDYYQELEYEPGESKRDFFSRLDVEPGPAHPRNLPYYLLLVGDPDQIPYRFQYLLDMQYAVGRIHFDRVEDYEAYADNVVEAERGAVDVRPEASFFGVGHPEDAATQQALEKLVHPLVRDLAKDRPNWPIRTVRPATKENLGKLFGGGETPAFAFTSAHGLRFPSGHPLQETHQGALICEDWLCGPPSLDGCFAAPDIKSEARFRGLIAFLFSCYSAGTPEKDNFPLAPFRNPRLAPNAMLSPLAKRLLAHPGGGALAVLGHVDRAWTRSFSSTSDKNGYLHFLALLEFLLDGHPIGSAMDWMNERFAEISTELTDLLDGPRRALEGENEDSVASLRRVVDLWRVNNDARNYVILGDPAVRLAMGNVSSDHGENTGSSAQRSGQRLPLAEVLERIKGRQPAELEIDLAKTVRMTREGGKIS